MEAETIGGQRRKEVTVRADLPAFSHRCGSVTSGLQPPAAEMTCRVLLWMAASLCESSLIF